MSSAPVDTAFSNISWSAVRAGPQYYAVSPLVLRVLLGSFNPFPQFGHQKPRLRTTSLLDTTITQTAGSHPEITMFTLLLQLLLALAAGVEKKDSEPLLKLKQRQPNANLFH